MADIRLAKPAAGASESVQCEPSARFVFDFPTTDATLARDGDNLNISFEDGSKLQLQGFYQEYTEENLPSFSVDGTDITAQDFFQAMNEPDLMPAAGPATSTVANGARFHEWGDSSLASGIEHLNGLDWGFSRAFEWEDHPNAVGYHDDDEGDWQRAGISSDAEAGNNPVTLAPERPGPLPPDTPEIPVGGTEPGNVDPAAPSDIRVISESGLRGGEPVSVNGAMRVTAPDGTASIEIAGHTIWANGDLLAPERIATDEGYFHNFAYDAASGRLTYTFTLTEATQEHSQPGADAIAHSLPIVVRDVDGDAAHGRLTIVVQDDVPTLESVSFDKAPVVDATDKEFTVNLDNLLTGADADGATLTVAVNGTVFTGQRNSGGEWEFVADTKKDGEDFVFRDGTFAYTRPDADMDGAQTDTYTFTATITDGDNDSVTQTNSITTIAKPKFVPDEDPTPDPGDGDSSSLEGQVSSVVTDDSALREGGAAEDADAAPDATVSGAFSLTMNGQPLTVEIKGKDGTDITLKFDAQGKLINQDGAEAIAENGYGQLAVTGTEVAGDTLTIRYTFTQTDVFKEHADPNDADDLAYDADSFTVTLKDDLGQTDEGTIRVSIHDDAPVFTPGSATPDTPIVDLEHPIDGLNFDFTAIDGNNLGAHFDTVYRNGYLQTSNGDWFSYTSSRSDRPAGYLTANGETFAITPTFVHYQYDVDEEGHLTVQNVIDLNNGINNTAKSLSFSSSDGLSVGGGINPSSAVNGANAGKISVLDGDLRMSQGEVVRFNGKDVSVDTRYKLANEYGGKAEDYNFINGANVSEAVVFDLKGDVAFGFNIGLNMDSGARVLLTFLMTPKNSDDDTIVKIVPVDSDTTLPIMVPDGYSKVIVSSVPTGSYELDPDSNGLKATLTGDAEANSGFTITSAKFLTTLYTAHGTVEAHSADGIESYAWDWSDIDGKWVHVKGTHNGEYKVSVDEDGVARLSDGTGNLKDGTELFKATLDGGTWTVELKYEFVLLGDDPDNPDPNPGDPFKIIAREPGDSDGDSTTLVIPIAPEFDRFTEMLSGKTTNDSQIKNDVYDDRIGGQDGNSLIFGKGGDDILLGDKLQWDGLTDADGKLTDSGDAGVNAVLEALRGMAIEGIQVGNSATNNSFINTVAGLDDDQKKLLGEQLEKLENKVDGGDDAIYGGLGNDFIFAGAGDDVILGYGRKNPWIDDDADIIYAGSGNDIIFYSDKANYINGGSGVDLLLGDASTPRLSEMKDAHKANVEVLIRTNLNSINSLGITSHAALLTYGVVLGEKAVQLDKAMWEYDDKTDTWHGKGAAEGLTLESIAPDGADYYGVFFMDEEVVPRGGQPEADTQGLEGFAVEEVSATLSGDQDATANSHDEGLGETPTMLAAARTASAPDHTAPEAGSEADAQAQAITGTDADETIIGGAGNDILYGEGGNDYLDGGAGRDWLYGGEGNDLIVYDPTDYLIDGGDGIDFLLAGDSQASLGQLLNAGNGENGMPIVNDVEVLIKGVDTASLTSMDKLAEKFGLRLEKGDDGQDRLLVDTDQWTRGETADGVTTWTNTTDANVTMETTLQSISEADGQAVLTAKVAAETGGNS